MVSLLRQTAQDSFNLIWLLWGLFLAGVLEAYLWTTPLFAWANVPIHTPWFGANKRWRGLVSLPCTHLLVVLGLQALEQTSHLIPDVWVSFADVNGLAYGLLVGLACNVAELPNSFLKRRLQIPPGDDSRPLVFVLDHCDSATGVLLTWWFLFDFPLDLVIVGVLLSPLLFMTATVIRLRFGLK